MTNYHPPFLNYFNALIKNQSIGRRLIINILIVSSLITLFSTIYQLYTDYNRDVNLIHQRMNQIQTSYLEGIINSIWMTDLNQAKILIQGIVRLPDMRYAEIRTGNDILIMEGEKDTERDLMIFRFPLQFTHQNERFELGELELAATLDRIYESLLDKVLVILLTQSIKTFLVSGFILLLVYWMITRHLGTMAHFAQSIKPEKMDKPLLLNRRKKNDELNELVDAFNGMCESLRNYYQQLNQELKLRQEAETKLMEYQDHLEEQVAQRTKDLSSTNQKLEEEISERIKAEKKLKASLEEKEVLLEEINHRVKNNMQIISSMIRLQFRNQTNPDLEIHLNDIQQRIQTMSLVHEKLYQSKSLSKINLPEFIRDLSGELMASYGTNETQIQLELELENINLEMGLTIPCGLIINELMTNAIKYAFPDDTNGKLKIALRHESTNRIRLTVEDDGPGLPEGVDWQHSKGIGLRLIHILSNQIQGDYQFQTLDGTSFSLIFPERLGNE